MSKPRVLVVEDEAALAKVLKLRLEMEGFEVRAAGDGQEAMEMIAQERPDIVVCDLMMPVMDGKQVTRAIKSDKKLKSIPVLILSALKRQQEMDELAKLGADGFAAKPFDSKELTARIRELIR
ncbi:MAG TPA: response regulator transcription factor [Candidatus Dormibacteraeota bacterium]|nr:response regulator transcription factor [Candidatus Dormibacteraeota bacterium]